VDAEGRFITPELDDMHPFFPEIERDAIRNEAKAIRAR
jgi:acetolactate synthase-1/2/3 large subunit